MNVQTTVERDGDHLVIRVPMTFKRRGGRKEIIVPAGLESARRSNSPTQEPLVTALARAFQWQELLDAGRYASIGDLAAQLGVDRSYVARIMRLTLLAPDIVEAIVDGQEPSGMSLERLVKQLPLDWDAQRAIFAAEGH